MNSWGWTKEHEIRFGLWDSIIPVLHDLSPDKECGDLELCLELDGFCTYYTYPTWDIALMAFHFCEFGLLVQKELGRFNPLEDRINIYLYWGDIEIAVING